MARLEEEERGDQQAARAWLMRASRADPDPAWCCRSCGNAVTEWVPVCGNCDAFDSHDWRSPAHVTHLAAPPPTAAITAVAPDGSAPARDGKALLAPRPNGGEPLAREITG
jgi:uncharacterized membrane-anchored protein